MNTFLKTLATALIGLGLTAGIAEASLPPKAKPELKPAAQTVRPEIKENDRLNVVPNGCSARGQAVQGTTCTAAMSTSRTGAPVRVIPLYNVTKVSVCMPDLEDCKTGR